jgi:hypothetical protein
VHWPVNLKKNLTSLGYGNTENGRRHLHGIDACVMMMAVVICWLGPCTLYAPILFVMLKTCYIYFGKLLTSKFSFSIKICFAVKILLSNVLMWTKFFYLHSRAIAADSTLHWPLRVRYLL